MSEHVWPGFYFLDTLPTLSLPQSPHVGMTSPYINLYIEVEEKNEGNNVELQP